MAALFVRQHASRSLSTYPDNTHGTWCPPTTRQLDSRIRGFIQPGRSIRVQQDYPFMPRDYRHSLRSSPPQYFIARGSVLKGRKHAEKGTREIFLLRRSDLFFNKIVRSRWYFCREKRVQILWRRAVVCTANAWTRLTLTAKIFRSSRNISRRNHGQYFPRGSLKRSLYPSRSLTDTSLCVWRFISICWFMHSSAIRDVTEMLRSDVILKNISTSKENVDIFLFFVW